MDDFYEKEYQRGHWFHDGQVKKGIAIVAINYDFYFELEKSDGMDMSEETPELNENGEMYLLYWYDAAFKTRESFSVAGLILEDAIEQAEKTVGQKIQWIGRTNG